MFKSAEANSFAAVHVKVYIVGEPGRVTIRIRRCQEGRITEDILIRVVLGFAMILA